VSAAVEALAGEPDVSVVYGEEAYWTDETGQPRGYPGRSYSPGMFSRECGSASRLPSCGALPSKASVLDETLQSAFDYDLWITLLHASVSGDARQMAAALKRGLNDAVRQVIDLKPKELLQRRYGYVPVNWVYGYACFLGHRTDQFYDPVRGSLGAYVRALVFGSRLNARHRARYWREWLSMLRQNAFEVLSSEFTARPRHFSIDGPGSRC
jgi:hypothetical protein